MINLNKKNGRNERYDLIEKALRILKVEMLLEKKDYFTTKQVIKCMESTLDKKKIDRAFKEKKLSRDIGLYLIKKYNRGELDGDKPYKGTPSERFWHFRFKIGVEGVDYPRMIKEKFEDFEPDYVLHGCGSAYVFGGVLSITGGKGLSLPISLGAFMGVKKKNKMEDEKGGKTEYYIMKGSELVTDTTFLNVNLAIKRGELVLPERFKLDGIEKLINIKTSNIDCDGYGERYGERYDVKNICNECHLSNKCKELSYSTESYLKTLREYNYCFCCQVSPRLRFGMSGTLAAFLATVAFIHKHKYSILGEIKKGQENKPINMWPDINNESCLSNKECSMTDITKKFKGKGSEKRIYLFPKYLQLCQVIEDMIHTNHETIDVDKGREELGIANFSSCGAPLATLFGRPAVVHIDEKGRLNELIILPKIPKTSLAGLMQVSMEKKSTAESLQLCIEYLTKGNISFYDASGNVISEIKSSNIIEKLRPLSNYIVERASILFPRIDSGVQTRRALISLMRLQQSIYRALGLDTGKVESFSISMERDNATGISLVGSGRGGIALFCCEASENLNYLDQILSKPDTNFEVIKPEEGRELIFSGAPLRYQKWS